MTDQSKYSVPNGHMLTLSDVKPSYTFSLHNGDKTVGTLDFNGPELRFTGDADASAKVFIDAIADTFVGRLKQERAQALEEAAKVCDRRAATYMYSSLANSTALLDAYEIRELIK